MSHRLPPVVLAVLPLLAAAPSADVLVVDQAGGAGADFTAIQPAVDAAVDGDVIVVRAGSYQNLSITGKSLAVVGEGQPSFFGFSNQGGTHFNEVLDLPAGSSVVLAGLVFTGVGLSVRNDAGSIWVEDCSLGGFAFVQSANASFVRCSVAVSTPFFPFQGDVAFYQCQVSGEAGPVGSVLCSDTDYAGCTLAGSGRRYAVTSPVSGGDDVTETYAGAPGEIAVLVASFGAVPWTFAPELGDAVHVSDSVPFLFVSRGVMPPSGEKTVTFGFDGLGGSEGFVLYEQALFFDPATLAVRPSNPAALVLLD